MNILNFIAGPWGALIGKLMLAGALATTLYVAISQYNNSIRETQALKDANAQLVQVNKSNEELQKKLVTIEKMNNDILVKLNQKNEKVIEKHNEVTRYIVSPEAKKSDRESSEILKETVRMHSNEK